MEALAADRRAMESGREAASVYADPTPRNCVVCCTSGFARDAPLALDWGFLSLFPTAPHRASTRSTSANSKLAREGTAARDWCFTTRPAPTTRESSSGATPVGRANRCRDSS